MICPVCNRNIPDGSNFCPACAADLTKHRKQGGAHPQQPKQGQDPMMSQQQSGRYYPPQNQPPMQGQNPMLSQQQSGRYYPPQGQPAQGQDPMMSQQQSGRYYPPQGQPAQGQDPMMSQQYSGQYQPPQGQQQYPQQYQQQYPQQYQQQFGRGEGGIFEGITPRGKLFFACGGLVLLVVLVLLIVKLFGGGNGNLAQTPPPTIQPQATYADYRNIFDVQATEEPEVDPLDNFDLAIQPTSAPTPMPVFTLLKKGSKGEEVRRLQERLQLLGYMPATELLDGDYGQATVDAVRAFQLAVGLGTDGAAGPLTQEKLFSIHIDPSVGAGDSQQQQQQNNEETVNQPG